MGLIKSIVIIVLILFALSYFAPEIYNSGKDKVVTYTKDKVKQWVVEELTEGKTRQEFLKKYEYKIINETIDFGTIGEQNCTTNLECEETFNIIGLECGGTGTCQILI